MALTHEENDILLSIRVPSENDPARPEFPDDNPRFPATPTVPIRGTGHLYENILNILKHESSGPTHDPRYTADTAIIRRCNFLGATTNDPKSKLEKLYSPHLPFVHYDEQWIRLYRSSGICGPASGVKAVQEEFVDEALALAERQGICCEPSGIAGLALLLQMRHEVPKDERILIVNTGKTHLPSWY